MNYLPIEFYCTLQSEAHFPQYTGSMLRGVLGNSLRHAVCMMKDKDCPDCMLVTTCIFPKLFTYVRAPDKSHAPPMMPPPFCLEPPLGHVCDFVRGDTFHFTLKLFSYAVDYLPYFIHAFKLAGQRGMGRGTDSGYGRLTIEDVRLEDGVSIYDALNEKLLPHKPQTLSQPRLCDFNPESSLTLNLLTPLRFKQSNRLTAALDFSLLLRLILRRLSSLYALERKEFRLSSEEFNHLRRLASSVCTRASDLRWLDWRRYSGRQNTTMQLGGLMGRISYTGPTEAFAEYLNLAVKAHLGKQTSFGLGCITVSRDGGDE